MQDLTTGSLSRHLLKTTSFMFVGMVFQTLYMLVDLYWVGRLGTDAVAGVGLSGNLMFIVLALSQMLGVGTTTMVSHAVGRKDHPQANLVFNQAQALSICTGLAFLGIAMALRTTYADVLSADAATARQAADYLLWFIPALALQFGMVAMGSALRGTGHFKPGMMVQIGTVLLNMVLAPILIFGWGTGVPMGVGGAALATFISIVVGMAWLTRFFGRGGSYLTFVPAQWRPRLSIWTGILKIGLPAGAEFLLIAVYAALVYVLTRPFGPAAQAGFGIGGRLLQAMFLPVVALGFAVSPVAGQNFGARLAHRVTHTFRDAAMMAVAIMGLFTLLAHVAPAAMIGVFSSDPAVIAIGAEYLRIVSWTFVASGVIFVSSSMFQAMGNTLPALATSFVRMIIIAVPLLILSRHPGFSLRWIWYLSVSATAIQLFLNLGLLRREFKRRLNFES